MDVIIRSLIMFIVLFVIVKILGKKQIKNLTLYDYVMSITIGSITADTIISVDLPLVNGIIALVVFGFIGYVMAIISYDNHDIEKIMDGEPLLLFFNNNFCYENLVIAKLSVAKVLEYCRLNGCFDINDLECAILEPCGDVSILLKNKSNKKDKMMFSVIIDGVLNDKDLKLAGKSKKWLNSYLKLNKKKIEDISLLGIDKNGKLSMFSY